MSFSRVQSSWFRFDGVTVIIVESKWLHFVERVCISVVMCCHLFIMKFLMGSKATVPPQTPKLACLHYSIKMVPVFYLLSS